MDTTETRTHEIVAVEARKTSTLRRRKSDAKLWTASLIALSIKIRAFFPSPALAVHMRLLGLTSGLRVQ
jgi:hypothetical protein